MDLLLNFPFCSCVMVKASSTQLLDQLAVFMVHNYEVFFKLNFMLLYHNSIIVKTSLLITLNRKIFKLNVKGHEPSQAELS